MIEGRGFEVMITLGTGLGCGIYIDGKAAQLELGHHPIGKRKTYEDLKAKGVECTQEPVEQSYGIDCGLRDPFGNAIRIVQPHAA